MKSVEPKIATGLYTIALLSFFLLLEIVSTIPLVSKYKKYVLIFIIISGQFIYSLFSSKYDPKDNDNVKAFIIGMLLLMLLCFLIYLLPSSGN